MAATAIPAPLKASALLRDAWDLVKRHPAQLALPLVILGMLTSGGDGGGRGRDLFDPATQLPWYAVVAAVVAGLVALAIVLVILAILLVLAAALMLTTTRAAFAAARGEPMPSLGEAWDEAKPRLVPSALALLLAMLLVIVGIILLVVPGIIVLGALLPLFAILLRESRSSTQSIGRAWDLTKGHRMDVSLVAAAGIGVIILASILLSWVPIIGDALAGAVGGLVQAILVVAGALFYERRLAAGAPH